MSLAALVVFSLPEFLNLLLGAGLEAGLSKLGEALPESTRRAARKALDEEEAVRRERMARIVDQASRTARQSIEENSQAAKDVTMLLEHRPFLEGLTASLLLDERLDLVGIQAGIEPALVLSGF